MDTAAMRSIHGGGWISRWETPSLHHGPATEIPFRSGNMVRYGHGIDGVLQRIPVELIPFFALERIGVI